MPIMQITSHHHHQNVCKVHKLHSSSATLRIKILKSVFKNKFVESSKTPGTAANLCGSLHKVTGWHVKNVLTEFRIALAQYIHYTILLQ